MKNAVSTMNARNLSKAGSDERDESDLRIIDCRQKVCVVGAGPGGLTVAKSLRRLGIDFDCYEAGNDVGGVWNVKSGLSAGYHSLRTNTSKNKMAFSDFAMEEGLPDFPHHSDVQAYMKSYASQFDILNRVHLNTAVKEIRRANDNTGEWFVSLHSGDTYRYRAVVVATGQHSDPQWPTHPSPEAFAGQVSHAFSYLDPKNPVDYSGQKLLIVGLGITALELAIEIAQSKLPKQIWVSGRSPRYILPKSLNNKPLDSKTFHPSVPLPWPIRLKPEAGSWIAQRGMKLMFKRIQKAAGDPYQLGFPKPEFEPWDELPTVIPDISPVIKSGEVKLKPGMESIAGREIKFTDGSSINADSILYATGYKKDFPFIAEDRAFFTPDRFALYQRILHPQMKNLFFVGYCRPICSSIPLVEQQGRWVANVLAGKIAIPNERTRIKEAKLMRKPLGTLCNFYVHELRTG